MNPLVTCPKCQDQQILQNVLTAQSNQNVIYFCEKCQYLLRNIETKKG